MTSGQPRYWFCQRSRNWKTLSLGEGLGEGLGFKCARPTDSVRAGVVNEMGDGRAKAAKAAKGKSRGFLSDCWLISSRFAETNQATH